MTKFRAEIQVAITTPEEKRTPYQEQIARIERAVLEHGFKGLYFSVEPFSVTQAAAPLDEARFDPLWKRIRELEIPLFWYIDDRAADRAAKFLERVEELHRWAEKYPEITSVITHGLVPAAIIG